MRWGLQGASIFLDDGGEFRFKDSMNRDASVEPSREELIALISAQAAEKAGLRGHIFELQSRPGFNTFNSGKPPSSDGLKKPPRVASLREPSGNKPGGQKGHEGETLRQVAEPNIIIDHYPQACAECGSMLMPAMATGHSARQVFDLPEPQPPVVTEHRAHDCQCATCGARTRAAFPEGVNAPVQYGQRITAFVLYLLHYQLLPEDRLVELLRDLFGVNLVAATLARMSRSYAERLPGFRGAPRHMVGAPPPKAQ